MGAKTRRVFVRVTQEQHDAMASRAKAYGLTISSLVLAAVDAYSRTYGEDVAADVAVAVNYGVWRRVDARLGRIDASLRDSARSLSGVRASLVACRRPDAADSSALRAALGDVRGCREDVARMRADVARCASLLDEVCEKAHLKDSCLGPLGDAADVSNASAEGLVTSDRGR